MMLFLLPAALAWPVDPACDPGPAPRIEPAAWRVYDFDEPTPGCAADFAPSGLDWHPGRAALVIASDEGQYATLKPGEAPTCYDLPGDNEAVAVVGEALIFAREDRALRDRARLVEVALGATAPARAWTISFPGAGGNDGVEGLAWTGEALAAGHQSVARIVGTMPDTHRDQVLPKPEHIRTLHQGISPGGCQDGHTESRKDLCCKRGLRRPAGGRRAGQDGPLRGHEEQVSQKEKIGGRPAAGEGPVHPNAGVGVGV